MMKKIVLLALLCIAGQMPQKANPEVAITKEVMPVIHTEIEMPKEAPREEARVGAAKKVLRGDGITQNTPRKGAAQKIREGIINY